VPPGPVSSEKFFRCMSPLPVHQQNTIYLNNLRLSTTGSVAYWQKSSCRSFPPPSGLSKRLTTYASEPSAKVNSPHAGISTRATYIPGREESRPGTTIAHLRIQEPRNGSCGRTVCRNCNGEEQPRW